MRIIYITRTFARNTNTDNCAGYRNYTVELLKNRYEVLVVTPGYESDMIIDSDGIISIPFRFRRTDMWLERIGVYDDYLKRWVDDAFEYLRERIHSDDVMMAVSGGELGCIMLASRLKYSVGCKMIVNFHDPVVATVVNGKKSTLRLHVNRDKALGKYIKDTDEIITCSNTYKSVLEHKYGETIPDIHNVYLGFRGKVEKDISHELHHPIHLVYAGTMSRTQGAERFVDLLADRDDIEIMYVGNASDEISNILDKKKNVRIIEPMPHEQYMNFIKEEADIGLVALNGVEYGACVPSKIYELINLEIPIFAILPDGDAVEIINNGYGYACQGDDKTEVKLKFEKLLDPDVFQTIRDNMRKDKSNWQMDMLFENVYVIINHMIKRGDNQ